MDSVFPLSDQNFQSLCLALGNKMSIFPENQCSRIHTDTIQCQGFFDKFLMMFPQTPE